MEDKKATTVLIGMMKKYPFETEEKEAISEAIGILSWSALAQSRMKDMKTKKDRKDAKFDI